MSSVLCRWGYSRLVSCFEDKTQSLTFHSSLSSPLRWRRPASGSHFVALSKSCKQTVLGNEPCEDKVWKIFRKRTVFGNLVPCSVHAVRGMRTKRRGRNRFWMLMEGTISQVGMTLSWSFQDVSEHCAKVRLVQKGSDRGLLTIVCINLVLL